MKKFSITKLETARPNPIAFATTLTENSLPFNNNPKSVRWLTALTTFHKTGNTAQALNYLENSFANRKQTSKNIKEVISLRQALLNYFDEHTQKKFNYYSHRTRLEIILSPKVKITGTIWLINSTVEGKYSSYTIVDDKTAQIWKSELRHPILQDYIAPKIFNCDRKDISVGIINYTTGQHEQQIFEDDDIEIALEELSYIGAKISSVL